MTTTTTCAQAPRARKAKPAPRKRADRSDAVTGEPLRDGTRRVPVRDWDPARELYRGDPIPLSLHSRAMESGKSGGSRDYQGAHVLSPQALRYFAHAVVSASQRIDGLHAWWLDAYVVGRLVGQFGERVVVCASAVERGADYVRVANAAGVAPRRVLKWRNSVRGAIRAHGYFRHGGRSSGSSGSSGSATTPKRGDRKRDGASSRASEPVSPAVPGDVPAHSVKSAWEPYADPATFVEPA